MHYNTYYTYSASALPQPAIPSGKPVRSVLLTTTSTAGAFTLLGANGVTFDYSLPVNSSSIVPISVTSIFNAPSGSKVTILN
jgi:hypothetical protein